MRSGDTFFDHLPEDWNVAKIGEVYDFTKKPKEIVYSNYDHLPFIAMDLIPINTPYLGKFKLKKSTEISSGTYIEDGDILLAKITPCFENGKQCIVTGLPNGFGIASTEIIPIKEKSGISSKHFLFYYLLKNDIRTLIAGKMEGATGRQRVPVHLIKDLLIPFPSLIEQQKIAAVLFKIQKTIEIQESIIERAQELKKSTLHHVFTRGLRRERMKETEIGWIPDSWKVVRIGEFASVITKGSSPKWQGFDYCEKGVRFIRSQNIGDGKLLLDDVVYLPTSFNEKEKRSIIHPGDLLINLVGASIGRTAVADERINGANTNQAVAIVRFKDRSLLNWFVMYYLLTTRGQEEINFNKKEIARANISLNDISNFFVPKPDEEEQEEVIRILKTIDEKIELHTAKKIALQDLFKTMLNKLMMGEIRVKDMDIDASEVSA